MLVSWTDTDADSGVDAASHTDAGPTQKGRYTDDKSRRDVRRRPQRRAHHRSAISILSADAPYPGIPFWDVFRGSPAMGPYSSCLRSALSRIPGFPYWHGVRADIRHHERRLHVRRNVRKEHHITPATCPPPLKSTRPRHDFVTVGVSGVCHVDPIDLAVEAERSFVVVVQRHRRAEADADVEAVIGGEQQRRADRYPALREDLPIDSHDDVERSGGPLLCIRGLHDDRRGAGLQFGR